MSILGAGRFHVYAFQRGEAREPGENVGELLFEVGPVGFAHGSGQLAGLLNQPPKRAVLAAPVVFVEVDVTDEPLKLSDCQRVSIAKKRGESSKPAGRSGVRPCGHSVSD